MSEIETFREARRALLEKFGTHPPDVAPEATYPESSTGFVLVLDPDHTAVNAKGRTVYVGIHSQLGWVKTTIEQVPGLSG